MSLRAPAPVSRWALNTMARPSGVNDGWLFVPSSCVSLTGTPTVRRFPVHFRSTTHRFVGFCALATAPPDIEAAINVIAAVDDSRRDTVDSPRPGNRLRIVEPSAPPG